MDKEEEKGNGFYPVQAYTSDALGLQINKTETEVDYMNNDAMDADQISFSQQSDNFCKRDELTNDFVYYKFEATIICNANVTGQGNGKILIADYTTDPCTLKVIIEHQAGCPASDLSGFYTFFDEYPEVIGALIIPIGAFIALVGKKWTPFINTGVSGVSMAGITLFLCYIFGWVLVSKGCLVVCLFLSIAVGVGSGYLVWKTHRLQVALMCLILGYFCGALMYDCIAEVFHFGPDWFFWICQVSAILISGGFGWY